MDDLELSIGFNLNNDEVEAELNQTRERIRGIGNEAARQEGILQRLERQAQIYARGMREATIPENIERYNRHLQTTQAEITRLTTLTNNAGQSGRSSFNGLQNSINQISRELPAFTFSAQTGFLAISNNLPILADELSRVRAANAALVASGQTATPVWKQLVSGLFSWGTALSLGVTLLTVYGKEITAWIGSLFQGKEALNSLAEQNKLNGQIQNEAIKGYAKEVSHLTTLKSVITDKTLTDKRRNEAVNEYNKIADKSNQIDKQALNNSTLIEAAINRQIELIQKRGLARAAESVIAQKAEALLLKQFEFDTKYSRFSDDAIKQQDSKAANAINSQAKKMGVKNVNPNELLAQSLLPDEAIQKMAAQDKKFAILLDAGTKKILKEVNARKFAIESARKNENGGYAGVAVGLEDISKLKTELDQATNVGMKYIKESGSKAPTVPTLSKAQINKIIAERKSLKEQIDNIDAEYARKSFSKDEEEMQALTDKFSKIGTAVLEFNKKHPKAALNLVQFNETKETAISDLKYKQQTAALTDELSKQKTLFTQYEDFKTKVGEAEAKKRLKTDFKALDGFKDYGARLQAEMDKINLTPAKEQTGGQLDFLAKLKADKEAFDADRKNKELQQYATDLKEFQTYAEKRLEIQKKYSELAAKFRANGEDGKAQEAIDTGVEEVSKLDEANVQKMASYKKVFDYVGKRSKQNTLDAIDEFQKELNAANITADARIAVQKKIDELKNKVEKGSGKDIEKLANDLAQIASEFSNINGNIGNIASVLVNAAKAYVSVKSDLKTLNDPKADTTAKIGAGLGIAGAAISVVNSVVGYFKGLKAAKEAAWKAMNDYQAAAIKGELDYQALLRKRESDDVKRGKNSYRAIVDQLELLKKQSPEVQKAYDTIFASLQGQSFVEGIGYKHGTWLRKAKTWDIMASLAGSQYADLEKLYTQGKLKEQAKADFESLKALKDELKDAGIAVEDLQAQLNELLTGTSVSGLADGLQQLFENGKYAAQDFGDSFTEIMKKAINSSFKEKLLKDAMQPFYDEFATLFVNGTPTEDEINALKAKYIALGQEFGDKFKELEKITGQSLTTTDTANSPNTIKGAVENITAKQADALTANIAGQRLAQLEGNQVNKAGFASLVKSGAEQLAAIREQHYVQMEIAANTLRTANNTEYLPKMSESLDSVNDNLNTMNKKISSTGDAKKAMGG